MKQSPSANHIKIGLIPLLLVVLYFVLPTKRPAPESTIQATATTRQARSERMPSSAPSGGASKLEWPQLGINELENTDPFDRRMLFPEVDSQNGSSLSNTTGDQLLVSAQALQGKKDEYKIQAVFQSPSGIAALVGDRVVHVGDQLADGRLVLGISADQLILAPSPDSVN